MAAIRAFLDYVSDRDVTVIHVLNELKKLPFQKTETAMVVDYLTQEEITAIVEATDAQTDKGLSMLMLIQSRRERRLKLPHPKAVLCPPISTQAGTRLLMKKH